MADGSSHGKHLSDVPPLEDRGGLRRVIARGLLWCGRALPFVAVGLVVWCRATAQTWRSAPIDDSGFTTALLPNVTFTVLFVAMLAAPLILLPVASSAATERIGDSLSAQTVIGRRTVDLSRARVWRASIPGRGWGSQVVLLRGEPHGPLFLVASEFWLAGDLTIPGTAVGAVRDRRQRWLLAFRGCVLVVVWGVVSFAGMAVGFVAAGLS